MILTPTLLLTLSACGCKHETWNEATCLAPRSCAECGKTEGAALGHIWLAATCDTPMTCTSCGRTEGASLGHTWEEATTEVPQTCVTCGTTDGRRIITDTRFTTASTKDLQGVWTMKIPVPEELAELNDLPDSVVSPDIQLVMEYTMETTYAEMEAQGLSRRECDLAIEATYGCSMEVYVKNILNSFNINAILSAFTVHGVYYVKDGQLYSSDSWEMKAEPAEYTLVGDTLTLLEDLGFGEDRAVFTRLSQS